MALQVIFFPAEHPADELRLRGVLRDTLQHIPHILHGDVDDFPPLQGERILFALPLGEYGINLSYQKYLLRLRQHPALLKNALAGLIVDGQSPLYTKSVATELALTANLSGCGFVGRPLVEGVGALENFHIQAQQLGTTLPQAYGVALNDLCQRITAYAPSVHTRPKLLVLHASSRQVSNSMDLWEGIHRHLGPHMDIQEIGLRNGTLSDCSGCPYTTCLHFGEQGGCFYGGVMSEAVYPAVRWADAILLVCPNYNDAISANLTACINRLTALFRQTRFYDKSVYAIVVSGYSGSDIVTRQLISALNMNKSFHLPPNFALIQRANSPGEALSIPNIQTTMEAFARQITDQLGQSM